MNTSLLEGVGVSSTAQEPNIQSSLVTNPLFVAHQGLGTIRPKISPKFAPNELCTQDGEKPFIRAVGSTPGTLDRIKRVVEKQKSDYGEVVPQWLNAEFLYRLNFGPATLEHVKQVRDILREAASGDAKDYMPCRRQITLLHRQMAQVLYRSIFSEGLAPTFLTDWKGEQPVHEPNDQRKRHRGPFDYDASPEMDTLIWFEHYVIFTVWSQSSTGLPPMAAVARDIISLVDDLRQLSLTSPQTVLTVLEKFATSNSQLYLISSSLTKNDIKDVPVARNLLTGLLGIAVASGRLEHHDNYGELRFTHPLSRGDLDLIRFPGPDVVDLGKMPLGKDARQSLHGTLNELTASYINSGPFRIRLTTVAAEHLTLSTSRELRIFWEGEACWNENARRRGFSRLGDVAFLKYNSLTLRKSLEVESLYDELQKSYALLFTRDSCSKRICQQLFLQYGVKVLIGNGKRTQTIEGKEYIPTGRCIRIEEWSSRFPGGTPTYTHFDHYWGHFAALKKEMADWQPTGVRDLFRPGYNNRFAWFALWVSLGFNLSLWIMMLVPSILQAYWTYKAGQAAPQQANQ